MFSPHFSNIRRASTTIYSVGEGRFLIIERIYFSPEFALFLVPKFQNNSIGFHRIFISQTISEFQFKSSSRRVHIIILLDRDVACHSLSTSHNNFWPWHGVQRHACSSQGQSYGDYVHLHQKFVYCITPIFRVE